MDISNNMLMAIVVVAVIIAAVFAFLFKGAQSTAYSKFKLLARGGAATLRLPTGSRRPMRNSQLVTLAGKELRTVDVTKRASAPKPVPHSG